MLGQAVTRRRLELLAIRVQGVGVCGYALAVDRLVGRHPTGAGLCVEMKQQWKLLRLGTVARDYIPSWTITSG